LKVAEVNLLQAKKDSSAIFCTPLGIVTEIIALLPQKALSPIACKLSGKLRERISQL
jgi:hypothetical protein